MDDRYPVAVKFNPVPPAFREIRNTGSRRPKGALTMKALPSLGVAPVRIYNMQLLFLTLMISSIDVTGKRAESWLAALSTPPPGSDRYTSRSLCELSLVVVAAEM